MHIKSCRSSIDSGRERPLTKQYKGWHRWMQEEEKYSWSRKTWICSSVILPNGVPSVLIQDDEREWITSQTKTTCITSEWVIFWKWTWEGRTRAFKLLLLRPQFDWMRKNQINWQHVIPCNLKPGFFAQRSTLVENDKKYYMREIAVPKNMETSSSRAAFGGRAMRERIDPVEMRRT